MNFNDRQKGKKKKHEKRENKTKKRTKGMNLLCGKNTNLWLLIYFSLKEVDLFKSHTFEEKKIPF